MRAAQYAIKIARRSLYMCTHRAETKLDGKLTLTIGQQHLCAVHDGDDAGHNMCDVYLHTKSTQGSKFPWGRGTHL
jgi:hypothetical protein